MRGRGRTAARVAVAAACVAFAAPSAARGQKCKGLSVSDCAKQYGKNLQLFPAKDIKEYKRALRLADWDVSSDDCADKKEIIEKTKKAAPAAFASANDKDAPIPEYFFWADSIRWKGIPSDGVHVWLKVNRGGKEVEAHLFMIDRNPDIPFFDAITHEMSHHADSTLSEADADAVMACVTRNEEEEEEEEENKGNKGGRGSGGGGMCYGCGGGGGGQVTVTVEHWECTWAPGVACDEEGDCWRIWIFEGCRRIG